MPPRSLSLPVARNFGDFAALDEAFARFDMNFLRFCPAVLGID